MSQSQTTASSYLTQAEFGKLVVRVAQDAEWIKTTRPTIPDLVRRYYNLIPGKTIVKQQVGKALESNSLKDSVSRAPNTGAQGLIAALYNRLNANAVVLKRLCSRLGEPCPELNWDETKSYEKTSPNV